MLQHEIFLSCMAEWTGLEPATPGVTGRYSNQTELPLHRDNQLFLGAAGIEPATFAL